MIVSRLSLCGGNHEIRNAYSIGLRDHFDYVGDKTYGSFNWGDTRIVMLDCGEDKTDDHWVYYDLNDFTQLRNEQVGFLKKELAAKEFKKAKNVSFCIISLFMVMMERIFVLNYGLSC